MITTKIHPLHISNWKRKTQTKIGYMLMDLIQSNNTDDGLQIEGITELSKRYHIGDKTFTKYLKLSIFDSSDGRYNKKVLSLGKIDIILIKEMIYLENRYQKLEQQQKNIIRFLIARLGKML